MFKCEFVNPQELNDALEEVEAGLIKKKEDKKAVAKFPVLNPFSPSYTAQIITFIQYIVHISNKGPAAYVDDD